MKRGWSLGLSVANRHLLPTRDRSVFRQAVRTWRVPWAPRYGSGWLSLLTASQKSLRSAATPDAHHSVTPAWGTHGDPVSAQQ